MVTEARNTLTTIAIRLDWSECLLAGWVGMHRRVDALIKDHPPTAGGPDPRQLWDLDIQGAAAELAVCKGLGRPWLAMGRRIPRGDDVDGLQVRWTRQHGNRLIIRVRDRGAAVFVLVTGEIPTFTLRGWITGAEAKRAGYDTDAGGRASAYFVPIADLHDIGSLTPWAG